MLIVLLFSDGNVPFENLTLQASLQATLLAKGLGAQVRCRLGQKSSTVKGSRTRTCSVSHPPHSEDVAGLHRARLAGTATGSCLCIMAAAGAKGCWWPGSSRIWHGLTLVITIYCSLLMKIAHAVPSPDTGMLSGEHAKHWEKMVKQGC